MTIPNQKQLELIVFEHRNLLYRYLGDKQIHFLKNNDYNSMKKIFHLNKDSELFLIIIPGYDPKKNYYYNDLRIILRYNENKTLKQRVELSLDKDYNYRVDLTYDY